ncbi:MULTISPECIES: SurA N-terminal domain-containing protein [Planomicrobium]|uniref:SurA N-terminal domain-containing protein n=1 Tax=Planomicrobium TaxID=162291 RepID=UPI000C7CCC31|nr:MULTISPECIES: SurA N-terminal domain-containing protein [Planomicrobium]PKH10839.1 peptidylprolyl isomerase [Planomicrobium sp. MB-3u-38]
MTKKMLLSLLIGASVLVTAACGNADENTNEEETATEEQATEEQAAEENGETAEQPEMPEPDLEGVPDVVAEVNGEEIGKEEFETAYVGQFQQMAMQAQMSGQEVDQAQLKEQIAESLVSQKLLVQETENRGIEASEEEVDETLTTLAEQNGMASSEEFLAALEEQDLSEEEVREQVASQVKVDKLIAEETGDTEVSEEELQEFYDQVKAQQEEMGGEEVPPLEDIKTELEAQLLQQKENEAVQALVAELREGAEVTINI